MDTRKTARAAFAAEGLSPSQWSNDAGARYEAHAHQHHKVLYCIEGSIDFHTEEGECALEPGDRIDLPPGTVHTAVVGPRGVTCWEAFRP